MTVSKKKRQQSSLANQKAVAKYKRANYDDIKLRVPKGYRDKVLRTAAEADGMSSNEYVLSTMAQKIAEEHPEIEGTDKWNISLAK